MNSTKWVFAYEAPSIILLKSKKMASSRDNVSLELLRRQLDRIQDSLNTGDEVLSSGGGDDGSLMSNANERIGKIEAAIEGLRNSQNLTVGAVVGVGAILVALGVYTLQRIDSLSDRVNALPFEISSE